MSLPQPMDDLEPFPGDNSPRALLVRRLRNRYNVIMNKLESANWQNTTQELRESFLRGTWITLMATTHDMVRDVPAVCDAIESLAAENAELKTALAKAIASPAATIEAG